VRQAWQQRHDDGDRRAVIAMMVLLLIKRSDMSQ
jgi:hypothetical protein